MFDGPKAEPQHIPDLVAWALDERGLRAAYGARPAKRDDTKRRRLAKMIAELRAGRGYMGIAWVP